MTIDAASKSIIGLTTIGQATALAAYNYPLTKKGKLKKQSTAKLFKKGVGTIAGLGLTESTANIIGSL